MQFVYKVSEPTFRELCDRVQPVYTVFYPTSRGLSAGGTACFTCAKTNLHPGDCQLWVHPVFTVSEPTSRDCWPGIQPVSTVSEPTSKWVS